MALLAVVDVRARIIARLHPKVIYQSHPEILPLGRASAGDQRGEFLFQHIPAAVPRIFAGQAIPVVIAPRNRQAARIIDLVGERRENRHHHHCRDQDAHPFPLFFFRAAGTATGITCTARFRRTGRSRLV